MVFEEFEKELNENLSGLSFQQKESFLSGIIDSNEENKNKRAIAYEIPAELHKTEGKSYSDSFKNAALNWEIYGFLISPENKKLAREAYFRAATNYKFASEAYSSKGESLKSELMLAKRADVLVLASTSRSHIFTLGMYSFVLCAALGVFLFSSPLTGYAITETEGSESFVWGFVLLILGLAGVTFFTWKKIKG